MSVGFVDSIMILLSKDDCGGMHGFGDSVG